MEERKENGFIFLRLTKKVVYYISKCCCVLEKHHNQMWYLTILMCSLYSIITSKPNWKYLIVESLNKDRAVLGIELTVSKPEEKLSWRTCSLTYPHTQTHTHTNTPTPPTLTTIPKTKTKQNRTKQTHGTDMPHATVFISVPYGIESRTDIFLPNMLAWGEKKGKSFTPIANLVNFPRISEVFIGNTKRSHLQGIIWWTLNLLTKKQQKNKTKQNKQTKKPRRLWMV